MNIRNVGSNIWRAKMRTNTKFGTSGLVVFLMVLEIFNNESVNWTFQYKLEYKLGEFNTWELVYDITDYKLEFMTLKLKKLDEIKHTEIFAVVKFWSGKITEFLR